MNKFQPRQSFGPKNNQNVNQFENQFSPQYQQNKQQYIPTKMDTSRITIPMRPNPYNRPVPMDINTHENFETIPEHYFQSNNHDQYYDYS